MRSLIHSLRPVRSWAFLAVILFATGCITIEEHYTFKRNGSGTMEYVVDMTEMAEMMKSMDAMDKKAKGKDKSKDNDKEAPPAMGLEEQSKQLKGLEGVKKVKFKEESDGYLQRVAFAFKDLDALNRALNVLMPDSTGVQQTFFRWEGNTLIRNSNKHAKEMVGDITSDADSSDLSSMMESMKYKYSFKFQDAIRDITLADGVKREDPKPKQVNLSTDWSVIMKDPKALDMRITLDK